MANVTTPTPKTTTPPPAPANGTKAPVEVKATPEVEAKEPKSRQRGPNRPDLLTPVQFVKALGGASPPQTNVKDLNELYERTGLAREKASFDFMKEMHRTLASKGLKVPPIAEFQKQPKVKYELDSLAALLGVEAPVKPATDK